MQRKGSYFYVIDAFIASIIITSTLLILFSQFLSQQSSTQAIYTAEDVLTTLETTQVTSYDHPQIREWISDGNITQQQTVLEQLVAFHLRGSGTCAGNTQRLAQIIANTTPSQVNLEILVEDRSCYSRGDPGTSSTLLSAKRIVILRQSPADLYRPIIVEVRTWQ